MSDPIVIGDAMLYQGDCLDVLRGIEDASVDAVVTDPPFAITGGLSNGMTSRNDTQFFEHWLTDVAKEIIRVTKPEGCMFIWCDWRTVGSIDRSFSRASERYVPWWVSQIIVHDRQMVGMGSPFRNQCDWIALVRGKKTKFNDRISKTTPNIFSEYSYYGKHEHHPAEKTVTAAARIVKWAADKGGVILDPFMGSGSTGKAAVLEGFRFVGIEREPEYFEIARARLTHATKPTRVQYDLFEEAG